MHARTRRSSPPDDAGAGAEDQFRPDSGDDGDYALPTAGVDPSLGHIHEERGREIDKVESHTMDLRTVMLGGHGVSRFVKETEHEEEQPELSDVAERFF